ncbi:MAG: hypothetical protein IKU42_01125 [Oscillospiraceae bacterium]|nr:hypothetical protein [Oscillospiraceae bacterium]
MNCPKCKAIIPDDAVFCNVCGCNVREELAKVRVAAPQQIVVKKKNPVNIFLIILTVILVLLCAFLVVTHYNTKDALLAENFSLENRLSAEEEKYSDLENKYNSLSEESSLAIEAYNALISEESWGYATENFHASTGIVYAKSYGPKETIKITMNYSGTTCTVDYSDFTVATVQFSDKKWDYGEATDLYIEPKNRGVCILTFTNDAYKSTFKVLVIVE